ncbi:MAG TPA: dihydrolipoyl dehydrogenase [Feifaniaceae bacterium]|nr:dihydrolipoyl dehydrogenase [Feifaniaceae bacterium]
MANASYDVAVIGGGPAGYVAAIRAAQLGAKAVLFEKDTLGGTCLNRGCIPTKAYIKTAETIETIRRAGTRGVGVDAGSLAVDMPAVVKYKDGVVKKLTDGVATLIRSNRIDFVRGEAAMEDEAHISCNGQIYGAKNTILCGGSVAGVIPIPGVEQENVVTSDEILKLTEVPGRLAIIGGGIIGCEIAVAFAAFGSKVTVVEALDKVASTLDGEVSAAVAKSLKAAGVAVITGAKVEKISNNGKLPVLVVSGREPIEADKVLLSIGRFADLSCLGKLKDTIKAEHRKVVADDYMRTNIPNIYAAGDIVYGRAMLAHAAFKMGEVAAANALGHNERVNLSNVPGCLYTLPEAASVGLTEEQAKEKYDVAVGKFHFSANGRAIASGETEGFVKVLVDKQYGEILGVHIVGGMATELITEAAALMSMEITAQEAASIIHPHPTFSEAFLEAVTDALGRCIHLPAKRS